MHMKIKLTLILLLLPSLCFSQAKPRNFDLVTGDYYKSLGMQLYFDKGRYECKNGVYAEIMYPSEYKGSKFGMNELNLSSEGERGAGKSCLLSKRTTQTDPEIPSDVMAGRFIRWIYYNSNNFTC
jgi:hypothetical protein